MSTDQNSAGFRALQRQLSAAAADAAPALVTRALGALAALAPEHARELEIESSAFASERGREGESHALWDRRVLPVFHERSAEDRTRTEDEGFLRRVTTRSERACRTLVVDEHGAWHLLYWTVSGRTVEHGSERASAAQGVTAVTVEQVIDILGAPRLAAALAALDFPGAGDCATLDAAGALAWGPLPACGYRIDDDSAEQLEPGDEPVAEEVPADDGELAAAVALPRRELRPLGRRALPALARPPAPWA